MNSKGKRLEYIIKIIQETLKDSPNTTIYQNYKIENIVGTKREFDVMIDSFINGFNIKIAIECKDFNRPISVEKIEAFETKCSMVPGIHKKIFISSNGFQKEAIKVAKAKGIELLIASKIDSNLILGWFSVSEISITLLSAGNANLLIDENEEYTKSIIYNIESPFIYKGNLTKLNDYLKETYLSNRNSINDIALSVWINLSVGQKEKPFYAPIKLRPEEFFLIDQNDKKIRVAGILINYQFLFTKTIVEIKESINLKELNGDLKASTMSLQLDEQTEGNFVKTLDNNTVLHLNGQNKDRSNLRIIAFTPTITKIIRFN